MSIQKLVVVNSFGPMGSTLLAPVVEKFGYFSAPFRKTGLNQYLMGEVDLRSGYMQRRTEEIVLAQSKPRITGGVGVTDRKLAPEIILADYEKVQEQLKALEQTDFSSVLDLFGSCAATYAEALTYKKPSCVSKLVKLTVDIHRFDPEKLYAAYEATFPQVKMIHVHREFGGWMNSLASMHFEHPDLQHRVCFFPHKRFADYDLYERSVAKMPGLHITFDEMFDTPIEALTQKIADFIEEPVPDIDWKKEEYDMYGKFVPFEKAFTRHDDAITFLSKSTKEHIVKHASDNSIASFPYNLSSWVLYLKDLCVYKTKRRKKIFQK